MRILPILLAVGCNTMPLPPALPGPTPPQTTQTDEERYGEPIVISADELPLPGSDGPKEIRVFVTIGKSEIVLKSPVHPQGLAIAWQDRGDTAALARLRVELVRVRDANPNNRKIMLSADRDAPYRTLVAVMDTARTDHEGAPLFDLVTLAVQAPE